MKIAAVVGARPNFVKIAPIMAELRLYPDVAATLVHTGQHYDRNMSETFFRDLDIPEPDLNLNVGPGTAAVQMAEIMLRLAPVFERDRPDVVLVVGDVTSTVAAALVAAKMGIAVAHVEAGLRSFDRTMPEEINRLLTDAVADYCFTTEPSAEENLAREGVPPARIHHVGNVMIDSLFRCRDRASASTIIERLGLTRRGYVVLTLHRPSNVDDPATLAQTLAALAPIRADVPVVFPVHPRTAARLGSGAPDTLAGLRLVDPLPYLDFVQLMANAACVATDSGGIQEETTALGVPCMTLRKNTERPITITDGTNRLVGTDAGKIAAGWTQVRAGRWPAGRLPELWDGKAAARIVRTLLDHGHH